MTKYWGDMELEHVASIKLAELLNFFQIIDHFGCFLLLNSAISEFRTQNFDIHSNLSTEQSSPDIFYLLSEV